MSTDRDDQYTATRDLLLEVHGEPSISYRPADGSGDVALTANAMRHRRADDDGHQVRAYTYSTADHATEPRRLDQIVDGGQVWTIVDWEDLRGGARIVTVERARLHSHGGV